MQYDQKDIGQLPKRTNDVSRRTMMVINVISAWVVNTYYNHLHQEAVQQHDLGKVESITDGYKLMVRVYLASFDSPEGYLKNLRLLQQYYAENTHTGAMSFGQWMKDMLQQFVPTEYFAIMSNTQQDDTIRNILRSAIRHFSSDVICTPLLGRLIENHDDPSIAVAMKESMKSALLYERERLFQALFKSMTNAPDKPTELVKRELCKLVEENVLLRHKYTQATTDLRRAIAALKTKDSTIARLTATIEQLHVKAANPLPAPMMRMAPIARAAADPPRTEAVRFVTAESERIVPAGPAPLVGVPIATPVVAPVVGADDTEEPEPVSPAPMHETLSQDMRAFMES